MKPRLLALLAAVTLGATSALAQPSQSLANEANYSDGHCHAYMYKMLKLGPLVGMPVPDIKLMNDYGVVITGKDQQLEAAVAELMKAVK
jgi:tricorn protease